MPRRLLLLCLLPWFCSRAPAQTIPGTEIPAIPAADSIGQWRSLQSFANGTYVTQSPESIIYTTGNAIFYLDKEDLSFTPLTKPQGLTETRIRRLRYHEPTGKLIVVYESGVIDLVSDDGSIETLRQISNFNFSGDKQIYGLFFGADNLVYIAAGYGVSALSLNDNTFRFTTFTGVRVDGVAAFRGDLYAATEEGLYRVPLSGVNLSDFGSWELLGADFGLPGDYTSTAVNVWMDELFFAVGTDVWRYTGELLELRRDEDEGRDWRIEYISPGPTRMIVGYRCTTSNCNARRVSLFDTRGRYIRGLQRCFFRTNYAVEDERGRLWLGDGAEDIRYLPDINTNDCELITYPGPPTDRNFRLFHDGDALWVAPSVLDVNFSPSIDNLGVYRYRNGSWDNIRRLHPEVFYGRNDSPGGNDDFNSVVDVDYDPVADRYYFSSFYEGLLRYDAQSGTGELFDEFNSTLQTSVGEAASRVRAGGARTDANGFTYVAASIAEEGDFVAVRSPEGEWGTLGTRGCSANTALDIHVDREGYVWVVHTVGRAEGLTVIDPMGTPLDPSDDRCRQFTMSNSALPTNSVRSIEVDLDGAVWVGTSQGIVIFECATAAFDTELCPGSRPGVRADDGFGGFLLETEDIRAIRTDGGNRKWIGTTGGVFLLSADGREQLAFFDTDNSPLLDNTVRSIAIDPGDGTVFFGTELGIVSFRSDATTATEQFREELTVFPNPVEPGYDGPIAVDGLQRNARVKVTDLSGKLVFEGTAAGGRFIWDGADYNGRRVTSGVYLVFAASNAAVAPRGGGFGTADPDAAVGKIVFLR